MTDVWLYHLWYIGILETLELYAQIELIVLHCDAWNHLSECKQMIQTILC